MAARNDPEAPLKDVWEIRRRIREEFGGDREKYYEYLIGLQQSPELRDRVVSKEDLDRIRRNSAA